MICEFFPGWFGECDSELEYWRSLMLVVMKLSVFAVWLHCIHCFCIVVQNEAWDRAGCIRHVGESGH